jgi:hypothetical protein
MEYTDFITRLRPDHPALAAEVATFLTLEHVLNWMKQRSLPLGTLDLVTQDEFCHDVLIPLPEAPRHLVFGIT